MQIKLDLVQIEHILADLSVDLVQLLIVVRPLRAAWLIIEELACTEVLGLEQSPREPLHHDDLGLLQVDAPCVSYQATVTPKLHLWLQLLLELLIFYEALLFEDLNVAVVDHLDRVWLEELYFGLEHASTDKGSAPPQTFSDVDHRVSFVGYVLVLSIRFSPLGGPDVLLFAVTLAKCRCEHFDDHKDIGCK